MIIVDGFTLALPACGVKSFTYSFLTSFSQYIANIGTKSKCLVLVPKFTPQENLGDYQAIARIKSLDKDKNIVFRPVVIPSFLLNFLKIFGRQSSFRRYFLFLWSYLIFPRQLKKFQNLFSISAVFHPYQVVSNYSVRAKKIVVIHDIFHWLNNQGYNPVERFFYNLAILGCRHCDQIISVSDYSKQQIINFLHVPAEKIVTCYEGINPIYGQTNFSSLTLNKFRKKFALPRHFILLFHSIRKYKKNILGNIKLYHELIKIQPGNSSQLVFVGGNLETNQEVKQYIVNNKLLDRVKFIERVNDDELRYLYHLADYLFFLSLEEGFGLPPLEALACGTFPVVSNTSSLGEIYSPYLPTFNPDKLKPIAQYLSKLSRTQREKIVIAAKEPLLKMYNWDRVIANYIKVLEA